MPPVEHNGEGFHYILFIKKDGKKNSTTISDWRENTKEFDFGQIYEPYQIWVEAANDEGTFDGRTDIHIGYTGEAGQCCIIYFCSLLYSQKSVKKTIQI